jgi:hypothetical protein
MKLRRLVALVTSIALVHVSVAVGGSACPPAGAGGRTTATSGHDASSMTDHGMAMAHDAAPGLTSHAARVDTSPCETTTRQHCCEAVAGCGIAVITADAGHDLASDPPVASRIGESLHDAPASFAPAPEPPPPKA